MVVTGNIVNYNKEYNPKLKTANIALDFGSTMTRGIFTGSDYFEPKLILLEPYVTKVSSESLEQVERNQLSYTDEENRSWIEYQKDYYALGFLAKLNYRATLTLEPLKIDLAVPQTLAIVGKIAQKLNLGASFAINLGVLLPWGEYKDRQRLESLLSEALSQFSYCGREYQVELLTFNCLPEGGGLFARGRPKEKTPVAEAVIWIVNIGYRNASLLLVEKGTLVKGFTSDLGFSMCIEKINNYVSGVREEDLLAAVCSSKEGFSDRSLSKLIRTSNRDSITVEREKLRLAKGFCIQEYVNILANWCSQKMRPRPDYSLIGGGTGYFLRRKLNLAMSANTGSKVYWSNNLERHVQSTFNCSRYLAGRLTDVYGFFFYLCDRLNRSASS